MTEFNWQRWFEESWAVREETIYKTLFGDTGPGIYPVDFDLFSSGFHQSDVDPRWLHDGIFECPPNNRRKSWLYASSGLSNPWEQDAASPGEVSGLGCEFILECQNQSRWALLLLRRMVAFQRLLSVGRFPGKDVLKVWDRIPLRGPIDGGSSALTWVVLTPSAEFGDAPQLPSGRFQLLRFIGTTEDEADYARTRGGEKLLDLLIERSTALVNNPSRTSVLS